MLLGAYRRAFIAEEGHSRSIRVDLSAAAASSDIDAMPNNHPEDENEDDAADRDGTSARLPYSVHTVACLSDNYAYLIVDRSGPPNRPHAVALVDPCEPTAVLRALARIEREEYSQGGLQPVALLTTHHHWDHAGGNSQLVKKYPRIAVYGGKDDQIACCTHPLSDGDEVMVGALRVHALHVPCHTRGSTCFVIHGPTPSLFGGDTFFCGGCGAPFEGTQAEMMHNFVKVWRHCAPSTLIFPGHEYTTSILPGYISGASPLPQHSAAFGKVCSLLWRAQQQRSMPSPVPTVPFILSDEMLFNTNFHTLRHAAEVLSCAYFQYVAFCAHSAAMQSTAPDVESPRDSMVPSQLPPTEVPDRAVFTSVASGKSSSRGGARASARVIELSNPLISADDDVFDAVPLGEAASSTRLASRHYSRLIIGITATVAAIGRCR